MIKVGFIGAVSKEWMGGLNYYKNLLLVLELFEVVGLNDYEQRSAVISPKN